MNSCRYIKKLSFYKCIFKDYNEIKMSLKNKNDCVLESIEIMYSQHWYKKISQFYDSIKFESFPYSVKTITVGEEVFYINE